MADNARRTSSVGAAVPLNVFKAGARGAAAVRGSATGIARGVGGAAKVVGSTAAKTAKGVGSTAANVATGAAKGVSKGVGNVAGQVGSGVAGVAVGVGKGVEGVAKGVAGGVAGVAVGVGKGVAGVAGGVAGGVANVAGTVGGGIGNVAGGVAGVVGGVAGHVTGAIMHLSGSDDSEGSDYYDDEDEMGAGKGRRRRRKRGKSSNASVNRPNYKAGYSGGFDPDGSDIDEEDESEGSELSGGDQAANNLLKAKLIEDSAGTHRLQRILKQNGVVWGDDEGDNNYDYEDPLEMVLDMRAQNKRGKTTIERIPDAKNAAQVGKFFSRVVLPPLKVDLVSLGGDFVLERGYPEDIMQQEVLLCMRCQEFESTGNENVALHSLQYPHDYAKHKRSLGLFLSFAAAGPGTTAKSHKLQYILIARSTTKPLLDPPIRKKTRSSPSSAPAAQRRNSTSMAKQERDDTERGDYDAMFGPGAEESFLEGSVTSFDVSTPDGKQAAVEIDESEAHQQQQQQQQQTQNNNSDDRESVEEESLTDPAALDLLPEIASFPVLVCMLLNADGTAPDIRKLIPLINLTTIQDLHATVVQLAFDNGDTIRIDFGNDSIAGLDKEKFIWSLLQIHSVLCLTVLERSTLPHAGGSAAVRAAANNNSMLLQPVNVRNFDRAELQYIATVNKFLTKSPLLCALLDRQRNLYTEDNPSNAGTKTDTKENNKKKTRFAATTDVNSQGEAKVEEKEDATAKANRLVEERDNMAYDLIMGNFSLRVNLYSEEERKDAEEILNAIHWETNSNTDGGGSNNNEVMEAGSVAERLGHLLHMRMRDLEAETCRRLIAWEDEKHYSARSAKLFTSSDERDTVDALALASLFKTLESLDTELQAMEDWLQERVAAIKPLTDDCADIEEENRQLEQQWKSYDMLGSEMKRLLLGMDIEDTVLKILKNPASALVYNEDGGVDVFESEVGVEDIYQAGRALQETIDFPKLCGGLHLDAVGERAEGLNAISTTFCTALAHIIVTVMEQFNEEVLSGSDYGKVSKNDTHAMIAKKIRDTQRKFQSALLGYIKLIEILAALSPDMLPAIRDAYSEMVAESILMKKRMKGYFQALQGKNSAYMSKAGKDLKDYVPFSDEEVLELVNAPDMRAALSELLPVIAREAYFTSALFGAATKEQDGREKKRNFESTRKAVDNASQHFRYYIERTCGILPDQIGGKTTIEGGVKGDPLLCLVGSIYLNEAMDNYIDREKKGGDHSLSLAYLRATILDLRKMADKQWVGWVEKQIEWIRSHDGVPLTGKRAGIFPSFARFPCYLDHLLLACSEGREEGYVPDIVHIKVINYYLQKLVATLLESLKECANRETTDQQYAANVMQMENTYFFTQTLKRRHEIFSQLFAKQIAKANTICKDSTDAYLGWMIKREFTSLHELFSKVTKLRKEVGDKQVPTQVSKAQFVRILQKEANRDIMKEKIGTMYARMEKHLSEEGTLLPIAWKALVKVLYEWFGRWEKMCSQIYGHTLNPSAVDIVRIAKAVGGDSKIKQGSSSDFGFKSILALGNKPTPP